ncbi:MAG TPA: glycosyltransferase [Gemmatimonadaceae bacterium]|nr:glycosyltransferase [Gemmatimonadaceae bacterium]
MSDATAAAIVATIPWIVTPIVASLRMARSTSLDAESPQPPADAPRVTVIVPARNESRNIAACLQSILASSYPQLEVIAVNDHSEDDTAAIARSIGSSDPRLIVLDNPDLPADWFGKQWACQTGADAASGEILVFMDADARAAPDLIVRSVNGMLRTQADFYSVLGRQEMVTFWERLLQMQVFTVLITRFGGTEIVNRSTKASAKIANGQYLMVRRATYDEFGGHGLVRGYVAEDLMLAQRYFELGKKTVLVKGMDQLSTRMYTSLAELMGGWRKNLFAGGRHSMPFGGRATWLAPVLLPLPFLMQLAPPVLLVVAIAFRIPALELWGAITTGVILLTWLAYYRFARVPMLYALLFPLGAAVTLYITLSAVLRGSRVEWKGREYESVHPASS